MSEQAFEISDKPEPANYAAPVTLADQLRYDDRVEAQLEGMGTFVDNGWDRWHWLITPGAKGPGVLTLQLTMAQHLTWWKRIEVSTSLFGSWFNIRTLSVANDTKTATVDLTPIDAQSGTLKLDFWKAGPLGFASYVTTLIIDVPTHLGKNVQFLCSRDHFSQP
ncbi:hypothetical protein [Nonomuraea turcica]|uniref:hypothetical protein n=1 Tax=Nonomuraea sp. G32 TaxID=3067274 RepID=UPI00273CCEB3|nr:hypothetical protein [Nonomuraea sp. G32]MDP4511731.1 hypothetical protein [Nonomuraea sp. G32]